MGADPHAVLFYGMPIKGGDEYSEGWDAGAFGLEYDSEEHERFYEDPETWAEKKLLASVGFTEVWSPGVEGFWDRKREAEQRVGVEVKQVGHVHGDYGTPVLAAWSQEVEYGPEKLSTPALLPKELDEYLDMACEVLGLQKPAEGYSWYLAAHYW